MKGEYSCVRFKASYDPVRLELIPIVIGYVYKSFSSYLQRSFRSEECLIACENSYHDACFDSVKSPVRWLYL